MQSKVPATSAGPNGTCALPPGAQRHHSQDQPDQRRRSEARDRQGQPGHRPGAGVEARGSNPAAPPGARRRSPSPAGSDEPEHEQRSGERRAGRPAPVSSHPHSPSIARDQHAQGDGHAERRPDDPGGHDQRAQVDDRRRRHPPGSARAAGSSASVQPMRPRPAPGTAAGRAARRADGTRDAFAAAAAPPAQQQPRDAPGCCRGAGPARRSPSSGCVPPSTSRHGRVSQSSPYSLGSSSASGSRSMMTQMNDPIARKNSAPTTTRSESRVAGHPAAARRRSPIGWPGRSGWRLSPAISSGCTEAAIASS